MRPCIEKEYGRGAQSQTLQLAVTGRWLFLRLEDYNRVARMNSFQPKIVRYESLPSTNTEAARLASQGAGEGLSVVADEQTAGRGRLQRTWISPRGAGLYLSILLRPEIPLESWPLITFAASLAVNESLRQACDLDTDIKWPNDVLADGKKLCGILAETIETQSGRAVVVGIGVNLSKDAFPPELLTIATSVAEASGRSPDRETILSGLLASFGKWYSLLQSSRGVESLLSEWSQRSSFARGKFVSVQNGAEVVTGVTCGLEADGALRLKLESGEVRTIRTGDVVALRSISAR